MRDRAADRDSLGRWTDEWSEGLGCHDIEAGMVGSGPGVIQVVVTSTPASCRARGMTEKAGRSITTIGKAGENPEAAKRGQAPEGLGQERSGRSVVGQTGNFLERAQLRAVPSKGISA